MKTQYCELISLNNKKAFLDFLNNTLPFDTPDGNLQVCQLDKASGRASKWRSWWEVRESPYWLARINQRLIGLPEIVFDLDPLKGEAETSFKERIHETIESLKTDGLEELGVFTTGSRGVHIHGMIQGLQFRNRTQVTKIKAFLLNKYHADPSKATTRSMIALEGVPHWKTGKPKRLISW